MTNKYEQMRSDINKMKTSYGNKFPMSFYPDTILELLDDLADLAELNENLKKEKQDADAGRKQRNKAKKAMSDEEIAKAVRPLYSSDEAAAMGFIDDVRTARAILSSIAQS